MWPMAAVDDVVIVGPAGAVVPGDATKREAHNLSTISAGTCEKPSVNEAW